MQSLNDYRQNHNNRIQKREVLSINEGWMSKVKVSATRAKKV